jgi:uncharacterized protein YjbJ (UPF0337 family)
MSDKTANGQNNGKVNQATGNRQQATGNRQQATGNRQQATGNRQQATGNYTLHLINRVNYPVAYFFIPVPQCGSISPTIAYFHIT